MYDSKEYTTKNLHIIRKAWTMPPVLPDAETMWELLKRPWHEPEWKRVDLRWWMPYVCNGRNRFVNCGLRIGDSPTAPWFMFVYAKQRPFTLTLSPMTQNACPAEFPADLPWEYGLASAHLWQPLEFETTSLLNVVHEWDFQDIDDRYVYVLPGMFRPHAGTLTAQGEILDFMDFCEHFPECTGTRDITKKDRDLERFRPSDFETYPWLKRWLMRRVLRPAKATVPKVRAGKKGDDDGWLDDDALREMTEEADALRMQWNIEHAHDIAMIKHFRVHHRGKGWTAVHKRVSIDEVRGESKHVDSKRYLICWGLQLTFAASIKAYGCEESGVIAYAWCHRHQHFFDIWKAAGLRSDFIFTADHAAEYVEHDSTSAGITRFQPGALAHERMAEVREQTPLGAAVRDPWKLNF